MPVIAMTFWPSPFGMGEIVAQHSGNCRRPVAACQDRQRWRGQRNDNRGYPANRAGDLRIAVPRPDDVGARNAVHIDGQPRNAAAEGDRRDIVRARREGDRVVVLLARIAGTAAGGIGGAKAFFIDRDDGMLGHGRAGSIGDGDGLRILRRIAVAIGHPDRESDRRVWRGDIAERREGPRPCRVDPQRPQSRNQDVGIEIVFVRADQHLGHSTCLIRADRARPGARVDGLPFNHAVRRVRNTKRGNVVENGDREGTRRSIEVAVGNLEGDPGQDVAVFAAGCRMLDRRGEDCLVGVGHFTGARPCGRAGNLDADYLRRAVAADKVTANQSEGYRVAVQGQQVRIECRRIE